MFKMIAKKQKKQNKVIWESCMFYHYWNMEIIER